MFLQAIALVKILPCLAEPGKIIVIGAPDRSLEEVIPYLATLPDIIAYNPETCTLTFRRPHGFMTLYAHRVTITQVDDTEHGIVLLDDIKDAINATWEHRSELTTITKPRRAPRPLDVWTLLPRTNCRKCNEATCMAFAVALIQNKREPGECPILDVDQRATLAAIL